MPDANGLRTLQTPQERGERENSTFLSDKDESGRWVDFHALRHTFITGLVTGGVNPKVAQTLARHSVITLTMDRYTHLYAGEPGIGAERAARPVRPYATSGSGHWNGREIRAESLVT